MTKTRYIVGIIAFIGTFAVSVGLVWLIFGFPTKPNYNYTRHKCNDRNADAIFSHISRDKRNGEIRDQRSFRTNNWERNGEIGYSIENHADSVANYVDEAYRMDVTDLPQDFQIAWQIHIAAWRDYSNYLNELKNSPETEKSDHRDFIFSENRYNNEINRSWYEVLRKGRIHGADVW